MITIHPILIPRLTGRADYVDNSAYAIWEEPRLNLGPILDRFSHPALTRIRISTFTNQIGRPVSFLFPGAPTLSAKIDVHDSNDVLNINRATPESYAEEDRHDQGLALAFANGLLEYDKDRETLFVAIALEAALIETEEKTLADKSGPMREITFSRSLAFSRHETNQGHRAAMPFVHELTRQMQEHLFLIAPQIKTGDRLLPLSAPGLVGLSNHERLGRLPSLSDEVRLLSRALGPIDASSIAPLIV